MKFVIALCLLLPVIATAQTTKTLSNRALDQDLKICVNDGGVEKCPVEIDGATGKFKGVDGLADASNPGLYNPGEVVGNQKSTAPSAGNVGEYFTVAGAGEAYSAASGYRSTGFMFTLTPGTWILQASLNIAVPNAAYQGHFRGILATSDVDSSAGLISDSIAFAVPNVTITNLGNSWRNPGSMFIYHVTTNTNIYGRVYSEENFSGTLAVNASAVRFQ